MIVGLGVSPMRRREFITLIGGAAAAWPLPLSAQTPSRLWKIGVLANEPWPPLEGLRNGLRDLGYVEGKSHRFEYRFAQGRAERFPALASELVDLPVDLIVAWGTPASLAAHKATSTIPIVMSSGDPVGVGIVSSLARPGGNVTGMSVQMAEQEGERLELLKKLLPDFSRVAVLSNPSNPYCVIAVREARLGATALGLQFDLVEASDSRGLDDAFLMLNRIGPDAVLVVADPFLARGSTHRRTNDQEPTTLHVLLPRECRRGRADDLYDELLRHLSSRGPFHRQDFKRCLARRFAGPAADQV